MTTMLRELLSNFTKCKRTPVIWLHLLFPVPLSFLFLLYYAKAGERLFGDARWFLILIEMGTPLFTGIAAAAFAQAEKNACGGQNALGLAELRGGVFLGKLCFLLSLAALNVILYEACFCLGCRYALGRNVMDGKDCLAVFGISVGVRFFLYLLHMTVSFRFGAGVSILLGLSGSILAGLLENPIGDGIWPAVPWEWGIRFLKGYFGISKEAVFGGILWGATATGILLAVSLLWFLRWEGNGTEE